MDITEKLATYGTQDKDKHYVREYRKGNQKWTFSRKEYLEIDIRHVSKRV